MDNFRNGRVRILLATNVAARGLDISHVEQVINMELPESPAAPHAPCRPHRPHQGREGQAITLLSREDHGKWRQPSVDSDARSPANRGRAHLPHGPMTVRLLPAERPWFATIRRIAPLRWNVLQ